MDIKNLKRELRTINNKIDLTLLRHKYKERRKFTCSDKELDEMIEEFRNGIMVNYVMLKVCMDKIKQIDAENKKVAKGKEESLQSQIDKTTKTILEEISEKN